MRVMVCVKASKASEAGEMPSQQLLTEMTEYNEQLVKAGIMLDGQGLHPTSKAKRVRFTGKQRKVIDGPFAETKELIAGYWIWQVKSMEEAVEWLKRCPNPHEEETEVEIRPIFAPEDFGEAFTPELREKEERQYAEMEKLKAGKQTVAATTKQVFINLPVRDLKKSMEFFGKLGYTFNPQFTDENAACMVVSDTIFVMLLVEPYFKTFTPKAVADAKTSTEALVALSQPSRDAVNDIVHAALAAGGKKYSDPKDYGFMFQWGFEDLDGHIWEHVWMDPSHIQG